MNDGEMQDETAKEIEAEIREERNRETQEGVMDSFISDNKDWLVKDFIENNAELFTDFNRQFGEDTHDDIKQGFVEYHYEAWNRFCREEYKNR
jgi:hypothetical protein